MIHTPYPPSANRYWRIYRNRAVPSAVADEFKRIVRYQNHHITPSEAPMWLDITLHPKRTKSGKASQVVIDLDNALKVLLDALQGVLYVNDKQIKRITIAYGEPVPDGGASVKWGAL